ncbi:hypothetical protein BpHYR1_007284 [Brachionus plicatilis]|uniref:Uncharacterized protein n=1 Tax=Brachionus plicatilis TaxID=10195 RepID=A0A3M7Q2N8_BRAPC|nr:hypothetical protein BpHYR1_007284 [Brachionus plicatilis]
MFRNWQKKKLANYFWHCETSRLMHGDIILCVNPVTSFDKQGTENKNLYFLSIIKVLIFNRLLIEKLSISNLYKKLKCSRQSGENSANPVNMRGNATKDGSIRSPTFVLYVKNLFWFKN